MEDFSEYFTSEVYDVSTEEFDVFNEMHKNHLNGKIEDYFLPVPFWQDVIFASFIGISGFILNSVILICYRGIKSSIALYIKVFAVVDMITIVGFNSISICHMILSKEDVLVQIFYRSINFVSSHLMLGPLFLAFDRALIVGFPHKFQLYETKMRIAKIVIFALTTAAGLGTAVIPFDSKLFAVFVGLASINQCLHMLVCVGLYLFIVVKIKKANRKMQEHRHLGNT